MDIHCERCGTMASPAGHEDARAFYQCENCKRVWMVHLTAPARACMQTPGTRVLVVDDSDSLVSLLQMWLEDEGYQVVTATSGRHAIEAIAAHDPDIVLLDLIIPPPDGFAICDQLRCRFRAPEIVVMTGVLEEDRLRRIEGAGIAALLRKPLTQESVLDSVSRARRRRWEQAGRAGAAH
jgi:CheY-like chemotaxis protein